MRKIYAALAVAGFVLPIWQFVRFTRDFGFDPVAFLTQPFANPAASMFACDLIVSAIVFWAFVFTQRVRHRWMYVVLTLLVGLSFALPLFLLARERNVGRE
jgi:uncharacterized protein DUF2834